jgi:hypothetical protein
MARARRPASDLDSPWKEALELFLPPFLQFFFPHIYDAIDWSRGYLSLDKELQQITADAGSGRRLADKLFKVWRKDGQEAWLLIHVEIQGRPEAGFPERMFQYSYRIYDRYRRPVVSLAVLCDDRADWRPNRFEISTWGCTIALDFPIVKLLDYRGREEELERSRNPFAAVVLAQLKELETRQDSQGRWEWKVRLMKGLYERGLSAEAVRQMLRLIDWMLKLPEELEERLQEEIHRFEKERKMPYVTSFERIATRRGIEQGLSQGLLEGIGVALVLKFGASGKKLLPKARKLDVEELRTLAQAIPTAKSLSELKAMIERA